MVLTMLAERKNSPSSGRPSTSSRTVCVKLPCATAAMARVTSAVGRSRSSTSVLTETSISPHAPLDSRNRVRSRVLPSLPTTCPTRFNSCAICWLAATISLNVSATFPASPVQDTGRRTEKSPSRMVLRAPRITLRSTEKGSPLEPEFPLLFTGCLASAIGLPSTGTLGSRLATAAVGFVLFLFMVNRLRGRGRLSLAKPAFHYYFFSRFSDVQKMKGERRQLDNTAPGEEWYREVLSSRVVVVAFDAKLSISD